MSLRNRELFNLLVVGVLTGIGFASVYIAQQAEVSTGVALLRARSSSPSTSRRTSSPATPSRTPIRTCSRSRPC